MATQTKARAGAATRTSAPTPLNLLSGLPDDRMCEVAANPAGTALQIGVPGTANILAYLPAGSFALHVQHLAADQAVEKVLLKGGPIVNHIADADKCSGSLKKAVDLVWREKRACFNHPASIIRTTRDQVARSLEGIAGLRIPKTIRHAFYGIDGLKSAVSQESLKFPVLIRIAGDHGGVSTIRSDRPENLAAVLKLNAFGKIVYVSEFVDFASKDGRYRKWRVAVVGKQMFLRHMIIGDHWLLHAESRGRNTETEEKRMLEYFAVERRAALEGMFIEIAKRLDLDWFGVDFHLGDDLTVTLFEANACMNILANTSPSPNMWDAPIANIRNALVRLLKNTELWRHPG